MPLNLKPRQLDSIPVSLAGVTPDALAGKSLAEVEQTSILYGNRKLALAELFDVAGDPADEVWHLDGDFSSVHNIALGMRRGELHLAGNAGRHAGRGMRGGSLSITGDAGDFVGAEMRGGRLEVAGNAGDYAGAALVGSKVGMRGGEILIRGNCGTHAGSGMRRGWVTVAGDCGGWAGYRMRAGSLFVFGNCGARPGAAMRRGTIALFGQSPQLLPTFRHACRIRPQALSLMLRQLAAHHVEPAKSQTGEVELYNGDFLEGGRLEGGRLEGGRGELLLAV